MKKLDKTLTKRLKQLFIQTKNEFSDNYLIVGIPNFFAKSLLLIAQ